MSTYNAGVLLNDDDQIVSTTDTPTQFFNGLGFNDQDELCIDTAAPITHYTGGLPFTATGALAVTVVTPVAVRAFSSGFSNGYQ